MTQPVGLESLISERAATALATTIGFESPRSSCRGEQQVDVNKMVQIQENNKSPVKKSANLFLFFTHCVILSSNYSN